MATNRGQYIQDFMATISEDLKLYSLLHTLITEQKLLYIEFKGDELAKNIQQQVPLLNRLNKNASQRTKCLKSLGLSNGSHSALRLFNALPESVRPKYTKQWHSLNQLVEQCKKLNQENGQSSAAFHELLSDLTHSSLTYEERITEVL
ncbi:flagellar export chaperone FlgN [Vibrio ziniensis]|uniref:Flagellar protein FlgN n=1 Tax=Vibrio ziniensis TaxID=2711221 RepID=A0A6G7CMJ7_9VIBR|nr:flagellar export chaperone FlgN [Vibrio ziniensis]QIH43332.1 flagellar protein FlgN [Vibrio ziniensis]